MEEEPKKQRRSSRRRSFRPRVSSDRIQSTDKTGNDESKVAIKSLIEAAQNALKDVEKEFKCEPNDLRNIEDQIENAEKALQERNGGADGLQSLLVGTDDQGQPKRPKLQTPDLSRLNSLESSLRGWKNLDLQRELEKHTKVDSLDLAALIEKSTQNPESVEAKSDYLDEIIESTKSFLISEKQLGEERKQKIIHLKKQLLFNTKPQLMTARRVAEKFATIRDI